MKLEYQRLLPQKDGITTAQAREALAPAPIDFSNGPTRMVLDLDLRARPRVMLDQQPLHPQKRRHWYGPSLVMEVVPLVGVQHP